MLALDLRRFHVDPVDILKDKENERLLSAVTRFAKLLSRLGYMVNPYSETSLKKLSETSAEKKSQITSYYENSLQWMEPDPQLPFEDMENLFLRRALDHYGLEASEEFWRTMENGQIIELYGEDMVQLYRNSHFYAITGYSLLDISLYEWFLLWDRPKHAMEQVAEHAKRVLTTYVPVQKFSVPKHIIREIYQSNLTEPFVPRAQMADFLYIGSLRASRADARLQKGLICSSYGEVIAVGSEALSVSFV
jgi:hypothetical protein